MTDSSNLDLDLDAIRYRLNEATPGPWGVGNGTHIVRGLEVTGRGSFTCIQSVAEVDDDDRCDWGDDRAVEIDPERDADFIAHSRADIPALLAEVDRLRAARTPHPAIWDAARNALLRARNLADDYEVAGDVETAQRIRQALHIPDSHELLAAAEQAPTTAEVTR